VAAEHVRPAAGEQYAGAPRIRLAGEQEDWPAPAPVVGSYRWPGPDEHLGVLYGQQLEPPRATWLWIAGADDGQQD